MSAFPSPIYRSQLLEMLASLGIKHVRVQFAGSGDEGQIEGIECTNAAGQEVNIDNQTLRWPTRSSRFNRHTNSWDSETTIETKKLSAILSDVTCDALSDAGLDWYNNEGGQGHLEIDFNQIPPSILIHCEINYMRTEDHEIDLTETEPEEDEDDDLEDE